MCDDHRHHGRTWQRNAARLQRETFLEMKRREGQNIGFIDRSELDSATRMTQDEVMSENPYSSYHSQPHYSNPDRFDYGQAHRYGQGYLPDNGRGPSHHNMPIPSGSSSHGLRPSDNGYGVCNREPYECITQSDETLSSLFMGVHRGTIELWERGSTINWIARMDGYPGKQEAMEAATALYKATERWNMALGGRVKFQYTTRFDDACFQLVYGGDRGGVLASAFFPDKWANALNTMKVYSAQFRKRHRPHMVNTMLHELGHILGLRHEHSQSGVDDWIPAEDRANGAESILWGVRNPKSVMAYYKGQDIQESDVKAIREAYDKLDDGQVIVGEGRFGNIHKTISRVKPNN